MDINVPTQRCSFFFFYYYSIESSSQTCKSSALLSRSTNLKSDKIIKSFELIKFPRSENGVRIRCFFRQLRQLLRTSVVDSLLQLIFKVNVKSSVSFSHLSLSLARADSTRNISVTWREKRDELVRGEPGREAGMDPHEIVG